MQAQARFDRCPKKVKMEIGAITLLLCFVCGSSMAFAEDTTNVDQAKQHVKTGEAAAEKSDWDVAAAEFQAATKLSDENAIAYYDLGIAHFHLGNLELAAEAEKHALRLDSHLLDAYVQLSAILTKVGDYAGAEQILEKAVKVDPHCETAKASLNELCRLKRENPDLFKKKKEAGLSFAGDETQPTASIDSPNQNASSAASSDRQSIAPDVEQNRPSIDATRIKHAG